MKFTGTFIGVKLDLSEYKQRLEQHLTDELHRVANAWLQVVAGSGGRVPLWSGMARASLLELSELINGRVVLTPLKAKSRIPKGRSLGQASQSISPSSVSLTIITNVEHYNIQEYQKSISPSSPWHSLLAGKVAYKNAVKSVRLPKLIFKPVSIKKI